jgi:hypothetical protein
MIQDMDVGADVEAFLPCDDAEGFGVQSSRTADRLLEDA